MKIQPGYKLTDVGVIPEDWDVEPLSEVVIEFCGGAPLRPSDFTKSGIKVLPKGAVGRTGWLQIESNEFQYCSLSYAAAHRSNQVDESYTIVVLRDLVPSGPSIGLMVRIKEPEKFVLAQGVYGFKVNQRGVPGYLVQLSNTRWYRQLMNSIMVGSTQVHITNSTFKRAKIPLPKPREQRAIAEALSDVDGLLGGLDRLIAKKRDLKQAAMQQLLTGQTRLPGFTGEWEVKWLGELLSYEQPTKYLVKSSEYSDANDIPVLTAGKTFILGYTDEDDGVFSKLPVIIFDDFTTATQYVTFPFKAKSSAMKILKPRSASVNPRLVYEMMQLIEFKLSEHKRYWISEFQKLEIKMPDEDEQTAIATVLSDMDAELAALEARRDKTRALKQAMMQELLTGRTRLV